jgi:ATP:cob(I)alamin adenosyltransferase
MSYNKFKPPVDTGQEINKKDWSNTQLYSGEIVNKSDRVISLLGILDEIICYIGVVKASYLGLTEINNIILDEQTKNFLFTRLTHIQQDLIDIQHSVGTGKKKDEKYITTRFKGQGRIGQLEHDMTLMQDVELNDVKKKTQPLNIIPGSSLLESELLYIRSLVRKSERQLCFVKNPDEDICLRYLNKLSDYFLVLAIHVLHIENRDYRQKE